MLENSIKSACAFTGHRPQRFNFGFDENDERCIKLKSFLAEQIMGLADKGVTTFYSGMALGVDTWAALAVLDIKKKHPNICLIAVLPNEEQANNWTAKQREAYFGTLEKCDDVVTLGERFSRQSIFLRNRYLVDHAEHLIAVYDGGTDGGTAYTVKYAKKNNRYVIIIDPNTFMVSVTGGDGGIK